MTSDNGWRDYAACRGHDVELFYSSQEEDIRAALVICDTCRVQRSCYDHAIAVGEVFGVWGGTRETQRRSSLRGQRRQEQDSQAA